MKPTDLQGCGVVDLEDVTDFPYNRL